MSIFNHLVNTSVLMACLTLRPKSKKTFMIKKLILLSCVLTFVLLPRMQAQTQVNNTGFENWENVGSSTEEPTEWNSFKTASGGWSGFASQQIKRSTVKRPGSTGTYSAVIWAKSTLGVIANGNVTTGQINMGSTTPSDASNYNITHTAQTAFSEALGARPDSLVVWVRTKISNSSHQPRISATIHDTYDYRDPNTGDASAPSHIVGTAILNYTTTGNVWVRKSIPFTYSGPATNPSYILISFTTCKDPGVGTAGDSVYVDDLQLIYNPPIATVSNTPGCGTGSVTVNSDKTGTQTFDLCDNAGTVLQTWTGSANSHTFTGLANGTYKGKVTFGSLVSLLSAATTLTNSVVPVASVSNTAGCGTGTVTVSSDQSGTQTFDLCDNAGAVLQTWTGAGTSHAFTGLANGTYKGKVTLGSCASLVSTATTLTNNAIPTATVSNTPGCGTGSVTVSSDQSGTQTFDLCDNAGAVLQTWTGAGTSHAFTGLANGTYKGKVTAGTCASTLSSATTLTNNAIPTATVSNTPGCGTGSVTVSSDQSGTQTFDLCDNAGTVLQTWTGAGTSHAFTGLANGTYKGKVTAGTCASAVSSSTTLTNNVVPVASVSNTAGCGTGTVTVSSDQSGTQTFDLCDNAGAVLQTWTGAGTSHAFTGLANGTYKGKVTLGSCASLVSTATTLTNNAVPTASVSNTPGCGSGSVTVSSDQSGTQTFDLCDNAGAVLQTWTGAGTSHVFTGLANGTYKGKVTAGSCASALSTATTLTNTAGPIATVSNTPGCGTGSVTVSSDQSGTQTFDLCDNAGAVLQTWTGAGTSHTFTGLANGTYKGKATAGSCSSAVSSATTLTNNVVPVASVSNTPGCGTGTVTVSSDQSGTQTFDLCDNAGAVLQTWTGAGTSHAFTGLANGTYKGKVTLGTCTSLVSLGTTLTNNTNPVATVSNTPGCGTGSVNVSSDQSGTQTFDLCDNAGAVLQTWTGAGTSHVFTGLTDGTYKGKVTAGTCASALSSATTLTNNAIPTATVSNTPGCGTGSVTVSSDQSGTQTFDLCDNAGAVLQTWTGAGTSHAFTGLANGTYKGKVTAGSCASAVSSATTLTNNVIPVASVTNTPGCGTGSVTVSSDQSGTQTFDLCDNAGAVLQTWTGAGTSHVFTGLADGTYKGKVTLGTCVSIVSTATTLTNNSTPVAGISATPACGSGSITITSTLSTTQDFNLCDGSGTVLLTWTGTTNSHTFTNVANGVYSASVSSGSCTSALTTNTSLINTPGPNAGISSTAGCDLGDVTITSDQSGVQTFNLCDNSGSVLDSWTGNATSHVFTGIADGAYTGTVSNAGCNSSLSIVSNLENNETPLATMTLSPACDAGDITVNSSLNAAQTFDLCDNSGTVLYTWNGTAASHTFTGLADGIYTAKVSTATCNSTLSAGSTLTNGVTPVITGQPASATVCDGDNASLIINSTTSGASYQWMVFNGSSWSQITSAGSNPVYGGWDTPTLTITGLSVANSLTSYRCVVTNGACIINSDSVTLTVDPCTGISENQPNSYQISPVPFNNELRINLSSPAKTMMRMMSIDGRLVMNIELAGKLSYTVSTETLPEGIYTISFTNENETKTMKVIKSH
jgi:hypothetical protein